MKKVKIALTALVAVGFTGAASADEPKGVEAGPRKGRLMATDSPRPEFFVEKDHTVSVKFYDEKMEVVPPGDRQVTVITSGSARARLELEKVDDTLVSKEKLPEGDGYNLVVLVRSSPDARPVNFRFKFLNYICEGCSNPEYACTCEEGEELERKGKKD